MQRRNFFSALAALPFVGSLFCNAKELPPQIDRTNEFMVGLLIEVDDNDGKPMLFHNTREVVHVDGDELPDANAFKGKWLVRKNRPVYQELESEMVMHKDRLVVNLIPSGETIAIYGRDYHLDSSVNHKQGMFAQSYFNVTRNVHAFYKEAMALRMKYNAT